MNTTASNGPSPYGKYTPRVEVIYMNNASSADVDPATRLINDRIDFETAQNHINFSIVSIQVNNLTIIVGYESGKKKSIRVKFVFNNTMYCLAVTDPLIEHNYLFLDVGEYLLNGKFLLTISLGEPFKGYCYKLVAGIIGPITL